MNTTLLLLVSPPWPTTDKYLASDLGNKLFVYSQNWACSTPTFWLREAREQDSQLKSGCGGLRIILNALKSFGNSNKL